MERYPVTVAGNQSLKEELDRLKNIERPAVIKAIAVARDHGDLKENAEYHAARDQQSFIEGRISEIDAKFAGIQVIDVTTLARDGRVVFGTTVEVYDDDTEEEKVYQVVGEDEADFKQGKISYNSPLARAMIGKKEGDDAVFQAPGGEKCLEIVSVKYI